MADFRNNGDMTVAVQNKRSGLWRPFALIGIIVVILVLARVFDLGQYLGSLREWIDSLGPWGPLVFIGLYAIAVVAAIPGSAMTVLAGAIFGSILGVIVVSIASTLGAALSFLIARYFAREAIAKWLSGKEKFRRLDDMTQRHGAVLVAITRLIPIFPFNLLNYGFGLTRVPFWTYLFWSWLCMLPATVLYVVGTDAVVRGVVRGEVPWALVITVLIAAGLLTVLARYAHGKLRSKEQK
jgi:uncharacterized membrane protein YdjX (TVP38/TMEM64 family)